jgi:hypothetical protein
MNKFSKFLSIVLGVFIILVAVASAIVSTGLSISYFQSLTNDDMLSYVVSGFVILLQGMVLLGSISKGIIYKRTPQHFYNIVRFTNVCFGISVLSTISFFNEFDKLQRIEVIRDLLYMIPFLNLNNNDWLVTNLTNMTLIWASCIVLDLMSMYFPAVGSDLITGISTRKKLTIKEKSYFTKIAELITFYPKKIIDDKCYNLGIIDENSLQENDVIEKPLQKDHSLQNPLHYKNTLQDFITPIQKPITKTKKPITCNENSLQNTKQCNDKSVMSNEQTNENIVKTVRNDRNDYVTNDSHLLHWSTEGLNEAEKNTLQKPITNIEKPIIRNEVNNSLQNDSLQNNSLQELITNIDNYITTHYKINEKIKVSEVKKKFGFKTNDRKWNDKIRPELKSCKVIGGRLTRIEMDNVKDNIKLVK